MANVYPETLILDHPRKSNLGIQKRKCNRIIYNKKTEKCGCLREINFHDQSVINRYLSEKNNPTNETWNRDTCTCDDGPTDAYGDILFLGASESISKYIRVSYKTNMDTMVQYLTSRPYWNLKKPELIISVTGGAKLNLKQRLKETFCKSLVKAATTTNGWITSGGSYNGCMKLVGEAFKENALSIDPTQKVVVLGIANWCSVAKYETLIKDKNLRAINNTVEYEMVKSKTKKVSFKCELLDPNHSHFILVDDARHDFGGEVEFRAKIESKLAKDFNSPIVVLVVGGGPRTAASVYEAVKKDTPCVFLEGSGEAVNLFTFALKKVKNKKEDEPIKQNEKSTLEKDATSKVKSDKDEDFHLDKSIMDELKKRAQKEYPNKKSEEIDVILRDIEMTLNPKYSQFLTVCKPINGNAEIDIAILRALLKAKNKSVNNENEIQTQLRLALKWNRIDVAKIFIMTDENKDKLGSLDGLMYTAILDNRIEFVQLFLDNGFALKTFLTYRVLLKLYNEIPKTSLLYKLLDKESRPINNVVSNLKPHSEKKRFTFKNIGNAIETLVEMFYQHKFTRLPFSKLTLDQVEHILEKDTDNYGKKKPGTIGIYNGLTDETLIDIDDKFENPEHELFMLSILLGRFEMAKLFCFNGHNPMCSALIATKIFKAFSTYFEDEASHCFEMAQEFEKIAFDILQKSYMTNPMKAELTLIRKIPEFDCTTIQAAVASTNLDIIAHNCFQSVLVRIWYHKIIPDTSSYKIIFSIAFPFLSPFFLDFREKKKSVQIKPPNNKINDIEDEIEKGMNEISNAVNEETEKILDEIEKSDFFDLGDSTETNYVGHLITFANAPLVKFIYFQAAYLLYLILFSYVILCDFYPLYQANELTSRGLAISIPEIVLIIWTFTFGLDEIRQFTINERKILKAKIVNYFKYIWNVIDLLALILFIIAIILRFIPDDSCFMAARIILSIDIILWFIRSLYGYAYLRSLGPKVLMIGQMSIQLMYFLLIVVLFMFAFGVSTQSLMYQNQPLDKYLIRRVFMPSYFIIGGEYYTRELIMKSSEGTCSEEDASNDGACADQVGASVTLAIYVIYLLFLNILLVNLVIAIFNNTYNEIEAQSNKIWKLQRYGLVYEFYYRPFFPPPLVLINYCYSTIKMIARFIHRNFYNSILIKNRILKYLTTESQSGFVYTFKNQSDEDHIIRWEDYITDELIHIKEKEVRETVDFKLDQNGQKLDGLLSKFDDIIDNSNEELNEKIDSIQKNIQTILDILSKQ